MTRYAEALNDFFHFSKERLIRLIVLFGVISEEIETAFPGIDQDPSPHEGSWVSLHLLHCTNYQCLSFSDL